MKKAPFILLVAGMILAGITFTGCGSYYIYDDGPHYNPHKHHHHDRSDHRIAKKIRKNEQRIMDYEHKIRQLERRIRYASHYKRQRYLDKIRYYEVKIRELEKRNRYLRGLLRH